MKRRLAVVLLGITVFLPLVSACGKKNEASKAAAESEKTEKEGNGEAADPGEAEEEEPEAETKEPDRIAILFPGERGDKRWAADAEEMQNAFREAGYESTVLFADGDAELQSRQVIDEAVEHTVAMVISPADPYGLSDALDSASEAGIPVFDYDELIMDTDSVDYFVTFDNREAGHQMAKKLSQDNSLERHKEDDPPLTAGYLMETGEVSTLFLYNGLLEEIGQYYESGALASVSGEAFDQASLVDQARGTLKEEQEEILRESAPDILCVSGPDSARIAEAVGTPEMYIIAGDSSAETVQAAADGIIDAFVFRDNRILAKKCAETVLTYLSGEDPEVSNYGDYDNGTRTVRTITCEEQTFDQGSFEVLLDNGVFSEDEIRLKEEEAPAEETPAEKTAEPTESPEGRTEARPGADRL